MDENQKNNLIKDTNSLIHKIINGYGCMNNNAVSAKEIYLDILKMDEKYPSFGWDRTAAYFRSRIPDSEVPF